MHITLIAGARPNFMKIAPIIRALDSTIAAGEGLLFGSYVVIYLWFRFTFEGKQRLLQSY